MGRLRHRPPTETIVLLSFLGLVSRLAVGGFAPPQLYAPPSLVCYQEWPVDPISINIEDAVPSTGTTTATLLNINLTTLHGSMRLSLSPSVYVLQGDIFNDSSYSLIGSPQDIRSTLKRVVYAPYMGFVGSDLLTITAAFVLPQTVNSQLYVSPSVKEVTSAIVNVTVNIGSPDSQQINSSGIIRSSAYNGILTVPSSIDTTEDSSVILVAGVTLYPFLGDGWNNAVIRQQAMNNWALQINITADHGRISVINAATGKDACNNVSPCTMNGTVSIMTTLLSTISYHSISGFNKLQGIDVVHFDAVFRSSFANPLLYGISTSSYVIVEPINHAPTINLLSNASLSLECFHNNQQGSVSTSFLISEVSSVSDADSGDTVTVSISSPYGKLSSVDDTISGEGTSTILLANSTITVYGRISAIQVALSRILYTLPSSCNSSYTDELMITVTDIANATASRSIHIMAVVNTADEVLSPLALYAPLAVYGTEDEAVSISGVFVTDSSNNSSGNGVDNAANTVLQVTVVATLGTVSFTGPNGVLQAVLGNAKARITAGTGTNDSVFTLLGGVDVINQVLASFSFQPVANMNSRWLVLGEVSLSVTEYGSAQTAVPMGDEYNMRHRQIKVYLTPINDLPVVIAPTYLSTSEDSFIAFANNPLSVHDADEQDAGGCHLTVDVTVSMGYLKMTGSEQMYGGDVRYLLVGTSSYDLEAAKTIKIQGAYPSDINDALSRLVYYPPQAWNGNDTVYVTASEGNNMTIASANISILVTLSGHLLVISAPTVIRLPGSTKMRLENVSISDVDLPSSGSVTRLVTLALTCDKGSVSMGTADLLSVVQIQESSWSMGGLGKRSRVVVVTAGLSFINMLLGTLTYYPPAGSVDNYDTLLLLTSSRSIYDNTPYTTSSGSGQSEKTVVIFTNKGTPEAIAKLRVLTSSLSVKAQVPIAIFTPSNLELAISFSSTVVDSDSAVFVAQCQNCSWTTSGDVSLLGVSMLGVSPPSQQLFLAGSVRSLQQALPLLLYTAHVSVAFANDNVTMRLLSSSDMDFVMSESQLIVRSSGRTLFPTLLSQTMIGTPSPLLEIQEDGMMNVSTHLGNESTLFTFDQEISDEICRVTVDGNVASMLLKSVMMTGDVVKVRCHPNVTLTLIYHRHDRIFFLTLPVP